MKKHTDHCVIILLLYVAAAGSGAGPSNANVEHPGVMCDGCDIPVLGLRFRSEERRVGKECRSRWSPYH